MHEKTLDEVTTELSNKISEVMFSEASDHMVRIDYDIAWEILYYLQDFKIMLDTAPET